MAQKGQIHRPISDILVDEPLDISRLLKTTAGTSVIKHTELEYEINSAKILVLYCGGTIGMRSHGGGIVNHEAFSTHTVTVLI